MIGARFALGVAFAAISFAFPARADVPPPEGRLFTRFGAGAAFDYERSHPNGGAPGASYTGWGPAFDLGVGRRIRPALALAGELQLAAINDRTQRYLGASYELADTLHLLTSLGVLADYAPQSRPWLHLGGGLGVSMVRDVDTSLGGSQTNWGWAASVHAGVERRISGHWSAGLLGQLTFYRFGSNDPAPGFSTTGLLPMLLAAFALN